MNSVYVPAQVVVLLKRLANVVGTFSISHHYLVHRRANADDQSTRGLDDLVPGIANSRDLTCNALASLKAIDWPSWPSEGDWKHARNRIVDKWTSMSRDVRSGKYDGLLRADTLSLPWTDRAITWASVFSFQLNLNPNDPQDNPPPPPNRRPDKKRNENPFKLSLAHEQKQSQLPPDTIHQLLASPALYDPLLKPRFPIVLCHGLYGFDTRGPASFPSMRVHYWANVLKILRDKVGAEVIVTSVPGTGSIASRATRLDEQLQVKARGRGINLLAHSMGGLDTRHLITHIKPSEYAPLSLTTVSTPHRGSPFMDWCAENIGIGKLRQQERELEYALNYDLPLDSLTSHTPEGDSTKAKLGSPFLSLAFSSLPSSFTTLLLSIVDSPAYSNLTSTYLNNVFNPATPNDPNVKYFSVASRLQNMTIWHPLWLPKLVLDETENTQRLKLKEMWEQHHEEGGRNNGEIPLWAQEREWGNDGLVTVQSAKWGEFLGIIEGCDHWEMRGARGIDFELPLLNNLGFGSASPSSDSWSIMDWSRFVSAWRREERIERNAQLQSSASRSDATAQDIQPLQGSPPSTQTQSRQQQDRAVEEDAVVKASTDKLSMVLDWLVDQIPTPAKSLSTSVSSLNLNINAPLKAPKNVAEAANEMVRELSKKTGSERQNDVGAGADATANVKGNGKGNGKTQTNELASKEDLERFYVALSRKLYDEGL